MLIIREITVAEVGQQAAGRGVPWGHVGSPAGAAPAWHAAGYGPRAGLRSSLKISQSSPAGRDRTSKRIIRACPAIRFYLRKFSAPCAHLVEFASTFG